MHYNTFNRNYCPATTTYRILEPRYKLIADIEDFFATDRETLRTSMKLWAELANR
jgi:hypothetical protein